MSMKDVKPEPHPAITEGLVRDLGTKMLATHQRLLGVEGDVAEIRGDVAEIKGLLIRTNAKATAPSSHDLEAQAALAQERLAREALAAKVTETQAMLEANTASTARIEKVVTSAFSSPRAKALGWALWLALVAWLASKGIKVGP